MKQSLSNVAVKGLFAAIVLGSMGCSMFGLRSVEEAHFRVVVESDDKEIREYSPRIIARTTVSGEYKKAQGKAFRILADYIFGKNAQKQEIAMTAPVTQGVGTKMTMTAPVTQENNGDGWTMSFAMPGKFKSISDLPKPIDERIELLQKPAGVYAAIRFTWLTDEEKNKGKASELMEWLREGNQYRAISIPIYAGYDPPWTIPFLRRQEMLVEVEEILEGESK